MKIHLILRKPSLEFNSIERVFSTINQYIEYERIVLPHSSKGWVNKLLNFLKLLKNRKKFVHHSGHDHYLFAFPLFSKSILTIHDIGGVHRLSGWKKWLFKKLWIEYPLKNVKAITTVSKFVRGELIELYGEIKPIYVIHNPLTLNVHYKPKNFNSQKTRVLQIGTKPNKNLDRLIQALIGIDALLVIVGKISNSQKEQLALNKIEYIALHALSEEELIMEYEKCDILTLVSTYEGFGLPIIEAQAIGRPVLSSNLASMPEVAGKGALLVNPFSVDEIRKGITTLINDGELRSELIKNGLINVNRFNVQKIAKQYKKMYESVLS